MHQPHLLLAGRQTSHFTRCTRIFAEHLGLTVEYQAIFDLMSLDPSDYRRNPALKMPVLEIDGEPLFGAINICRELVRLAGSPEGYVWPEDLDDRDLSNAQELVLQAMSTEVTLILSRMSGVDADNTHLKKARTSLTNSLEWLETRWPDLLTRLPRNRRLSLLEVLAFCLVTHLEFREVVPLDGYPDLQAFGHRFGQQGCARATIYRVDVK